MNRGETQHPWLLGKFHSEENMQLLLSLPVHTSQLLNWARLCSLVADGLGVQRKSAECLVLSTSRNRTPFTLDQSHTVGPETSAGE